MPNASATPTRAGERSSAILRNTPNPPPITLNDNVDTGGAVSDYWYVQQGFKELAEYFSHPEVHDVDRADRRHNLVSPRELAAALPDLEQKLPPAAAVARALLAEPRDAYEATRDLQSENLWGQVQAPQVSLRDLYAAARGTGFHNEKLDAPKVYDKVQKHIDAYEKLKQAREVASIPDPVWREIASGVDHAGNSDGWLSIDPNGYVEGDEMQRALQAIGMHERFAGLRPNDIYENVSPKHASAQAVIDDYLASRDAAAKQPPMTSIPLAMLRDVTVRAYARELAGKGMSVPLTYGDDGQPSGALAALVAAVKARNGVFPGGDAWITDRDRLVRDGDAIDSVLRKLPPQELFDFTSFGVLANAYARDGELTPDSIKKDDNRGRFYNQTEVMPDFQVRPMREAQIYAYRARFPHNLDALGAAMSNAGVSGVPVGHVVAMADALYKRAQDSGTIGAVYDAHTMMGAEAEQGFRPLTLTKAQETKLESFFAQPPPAPAQLSAVEREALLTGRLTREEIGELRNLRAATQYFEQSTDLKDDYGGWTGNILSENYPEVLGWMQDTSGLTFPRAVRNLNYGQTNCLEEAHTYSNFLQQIEAHGLLQYFAPTGIIRKVSQHGLGDYWQTVHAGVLLTRRANGDSYVLDSWVDGGGTPAHIVRAREWLEGHYQASTVAPPGAPAYVPGKTV